MIGYISGLLLFTATSFAGANAEELLITDVATSGYITNKQPFLLFCQAINADSVKFRCNGRWVPESRTDSRRGHDDNGRAFVRSELNVSRTEGEETCECYATRGDRTVRSEETRIAVPYLRKHFVQTASSSGVREGSTVALSCLPPEGDPPPAISWTKDGVPVAPDGYVLIASDGSLLLSSARLRDQGSYVCTASNLAGKRAAPPTAIHVYVDGSWSEWGDWGGSCLVDCPALAMAVNEHGEEVIPRITRRRTCNNPAPLNGGMHCQGNEEESRVCPIDCRLDGRWSAWGRWSECSSACERKRTRSCTQPPPINGGATCPGVEDETLECATGVCASRPLSDWLVVLSLLCVFALLAVVVSLCLILLSRQRTKPTIYYGDVASCSGEPHKSFASDPPLFDSPLPTSTTLRSNRSIYMRCESGYHTRGNDSRLALLPDGSSTSSSARKAFVRTASSMSEEENYATVYECLREDMDWKDSVLAARVDREGARLSMHNTGTCLVIPEDSYNSPSLIFLSTRPPIHDLPILNDSELPLSSIVSISSSASSPRYPFVLSMPYCASSRDEWDLFVYHDTGIGWLRENIEDDPQTPQSPASVHCHIDPHAPAVVHCIIPSYSRVLLAGRPKRPNSSRRVRVAIFAPIEKRQLFALRVVVALEGAGTSSLREEEERGNRLLLESPSLPLALDGGPLCLCLEDTSHGFRPLETYAEISFMPQHSSLSCSFGVEAEERNATFSGRLVILQKGSSAPPLPMSFTVDDDYEQLLLQDESVVSLDFRLPFSVKQRVSSLLDPPSERDWRSLSRSLRSSSLVPYAASFPSPTLVLLSLWESRREDVCHLAHALRLSGRPDVAQIVEKIIHC